MNKALFLIKIVQFFPIAKEIKTELVRFLIEKVQFLVEFVKFLSKEYDFDQKIERFHTDRREFKSKLYVFDRYGNGPYFYLEIKR